MHLDRIKNALGTSEKYVEEMEKMGIFEECFNRGIKFKKNYNHYESDELYFVKDGVIFINY